MLQEMMLQQAGVPAVYRHMYPTVELATLESAANQVRYFSGATHGHDRGKPFFKKETGDRLNFDYNNLVNNGQGGIRVGDRYYPSTCSIYGEDLGSGSRLRTAEYGALVILAEDKYGGRDKFQRYTQGESDTWLDEYEPIPDDPRGE
jgi:hypothetical protein